MESGNQLNGTFPLIASLAGHGHVQPNYELAEVAELDGKCRQSKRPVSNIKATATPSSRPQASNNRFRMDVTASPFSLERRLQRERNVEALRRLTAEVKQRHPEHFEPGVRRSGA